MSKKPPSDPRQYLKSPASTAYDVGYARPPAKTQFQKGHSGNPKGRPKGAKNRAPALNEERLKSIIMAEAYRPVKVNDGRRQISIPMAQAVVRSIAVQAAKGQHRSQKLFSDMLTGTERANKALHDSWLETAIDYKLEWERELERRARLGITAPDPVPHPSDIEIDMRTGEVIVKGPFTKEEAARLQGWKERLADFREELEFFRAQRAKSRGKNAAWYDEEIARTQKVIGLLETIVNSGKIPPWMPHHGHGSDE